jgi:hypothetical protein
MNAYGTDVKNSDLLETLGISTEWPWGFFGWSLVAENPEMPTNGEPSTGVAISTDIRNTQVPEPTSLLLLGTGLIGLGIIARRRK